MYALSGHPLLSSRLPSLLVCSTAVPSHRSLLVKTGGTETPETATLPSPRGLEPDPAGLAYVPVAHANAHHVSGIIAV